MIQQTILIFEQIRQSIYLKIMNLITISVSFIFIFLLICFSLIIISKGYNFLNRAFQFEFKLTVHRYCALFRFLNFPQHRMQIQERKVKPHEELSIQLPNPQLNLQFGQCPEPNDQIIEVVYKLPNLKQIRPFPTVRQGLDTTDANIRHDTMENVNPDLNNLQNGPNQIQLRQNTKKNWITFIVISFFLLISISAIMAYFVDWKSSPSSDPNKKNQGNQQNQDNQQNNNHEQNYDTISRQYICSLKQNLCAGVPESVMQYVFDTYSEANSIKSVLQVAKSLSLVASINTKGQIQDIRQYCSQKYREIAKGVECLSYVLPNNYSQAYQNLTNIHFTTQQNIKKYLTMLQAFSGQPYKLLKVSDSIQACDFSVAPTIIAQRSLQMQVSNPNPAKNSRLMQDSNFTNPRIVIYIDGTGYAPNTVVQNLKKLKQTLAGDSRTSFYGENIVSMGMWLRSNKNQLSKFEYFDRLVYSYELQMSNKGLKLPSRKGIYESLKLISHTCRNKEYIPNEFSTQSFSQLLKIHKSRTAQQTTNSSIERNYDLSVHRQFIIQQLNEGRRVAIVAHGEGAMLSNALYNSLSTAHKRSVALAYVAAFSCYIPQTKAQYITNGLDIVVQHFKKFDQGNKFCWFGNKLQPNQQYSLKPNVNPNVFADDTIGLNHYMTGYLQAYSGEFQSIMANASNRHMMPGKLIGTEQITVNVVWTSSPNNSSSEIDLHIYEPDDTHVYEYNKQSKNGYLDNNGSSINEHYFTNPIINPGEFIVRLNYHYGTVDVNATVIVNAGSQYFIKRLFLNPPIKSTSKSDAPIYVCTISVKQNIKTKSKEFMIFS